MNTTPVKPNIYAIACMGRNGFYDSKTVYVAKPTAVPAIVPPVPTSRVFETHHLHQPNKLNKFCRNLCRWLARHAPLMGEIKGQLSDMEAEEQLMNDVRQETALINVEVKTLKDEQESYIEALPKCITNSPNPKKPAPAPEPKVVNKISARIVNEVRIALIAKVGFMGDTTANRLLVDKEARRLMKANNFREVVVASHLPHIVNAYFNCRVEEEKAGGARRKCSNWLLRLLGFSTVNTTSQ